MFWKVCCQEYGPSTTLLKWRMWFATISVLNSSFVGGFDARNSADRVASSGIVQCLGRIKVNDTNADQNNEMNVLNDARSRS